jgi:DNA-binding CsgD family transcriptional regulator
MELHKRRCESISNVDLNGFFMDLAGNLRHMSLLARHRDQIPTYLARVLELESLHLAVVGHWPGQPSKITTLASCGCPTDGTAPESPVIAARFLELANRLLADAAHQILPVPESVDYGRFGGVSRERVIFRQINDCQLLLLLQQEPVGQPPVPEFVGKVLELAADYLTKMFRVTLECEGCPEKMGRSFDRLTKMEWNVLCALESEDSEKQLAAHLGMSPHTLHAHIKNIYRKVGVGARLAVVQRIGEARFAYQMREHANEVQGELQLCT